MLLLNEQDIRKVFDMNDAIDSNIEHIRFFLVGTQLYRFVKLSLLMKEEVTLRLCQLIAQSLERRALKS